LDKYTSTAFKILEDETVDKDVKLYLILDLLHDNKISLQKAYELCEENGIFSDYKIVIDAKTIEIWEEYYNA
jgi:hypothetical protein